METSTKIELQHVLHACPVLSSVIETPIKLARISPVHLPVAEALTDIIVSQRIKAKEADKITRCIRERAGSTKIWRLSEEDLFISGVSRSKARTIHLMGRHYDENPRKFEAWRSEPEQQVRSEIKLLWGLGDWTADMLLLKYFGHSDIWPHQDGVIAHVLEDLKRVCKLRHIPWQFQPEKAAPYRSYLTLLMWQIDQMDIQHQVRERFNLPIARYIYQVAG